MSKIRSFIFSIKRKISIYWINFQYATHSRKIILICRLIKTFFFIYILKRQPLRYVDLAIDYTCNLKCSHCFATALRNGKEGRRLSIQDYRKIARDCMKLGAVNFSFQGGEPLLFADLFDIIKAFQPSKNVISVTTNGTLLTEENVKKLKDSGVDILTISLDSFIAEEHDSFRGENGTYKKTIKGIQYARSAGLRVTIGTVVSSRNIRTKGFQQLIEFCKKERISLVFALAVPAGKWSNNMEILLSENDLVYINELCKDSPFIKTDFEANYRYFGCGAAKEILYITPYGDVLPCPFIHISFGNVFDNPIKDIREKALHNPYFKNYCHSCLAATDRYFIEKYLSKTFDVDHLPLTSEEVFVEKELQSSLPE